MAMPPTEKWLFELKALTAIACASAAVPPFEAELASISGKYSFLFLSS
jgi:hypothetical protein